jgi:hypothetical protein
MAKSHGPDRKQWAYRAAGGLDNSTLGKDVTKTEEVTANQAILMNDSLKLLKKAGVHTGLSSQG